MRLFAKYVFLCLCSLGLGNVSVAQNINYPVTVTPFFSPNYTNQWSEFYGERLLNISIIIKDNAQLSGNVKVFARFSLERVGITIQNPADFVPTHGTPLSFGNQVTLTGADLSESFLPQNLVVSGIDDAFLRQGGSLPDGFWTFKITLYEFDAARGYRQISNQGVCNMSVFWGQPPLLLFPAKDSEIDSKYIPNVLFQWMPRATSAEGGMASIAYTFQLWQLGDDENENDVGTGKNPVYEETVNSPFLNYDASKTPLIAGKNYAWRVTVKDIGGNNAYENEGKSEVWKFRYGISCKAPTGLTITNVGNGMREITWDLMPEAASYELRWRQEPKNEELSQTTTLNYVNMLLSSEDVYHFEVRTLCKNAENSPWSETVDYGQIQTSKGASPTAKTFASGSVDNSSSTTNNVFDPENIVVSGSEVDPTKMDALTQELNTTPNPTEQRCGVSVINNSSNCETPATSTYSGTTPFTSLVNSTIYINGYDIRITKVNNNNSGEGLLYFPYLGRRIPVEWNGNTIVKGEGEYGCITTGIVQAQGSDASILTNDLQRQIAALYNNLNEPGSYSGTFGQAIEAMKTLATELATKGTVDNNDPILTKFKSVCSAVKKGASDWKNSLETTFGKPSILSEINDLYTQIDNAAAQLVAILDCNPTGYFLIPQKDKLNENPILYAKAEKPLDKSSFAKSPQLVLLSCDYRGTQLSAQTLLNGFSLVKKLDKTLNADTYTNTTENGKTYSCSDGTKAIIDFAGASADRTTGINPPIYTINNKKYQCFWSDNTVFGFFEVSKLATIKGKENALNLKTIGSYTPFTVISYEPNSPSCKLKADDFDPNSQGLYFTEVGLNQLKNKLNGQGANNTEITVKDCTDPTKPQKTVTRNSTTATAGQKTIQIQMCWDGTKWKTTISKFEPNTTNATAKGMKNIAEAGQAAKDAAQNALDNNKGVDAYSQKSPDGVHQFTVGSADALESAVYFLETGKYLIENLEVPPESWQGGGPSKKVLSIPPVLGGGTDQGLAEVKDLKQMVDLGVAFVKEPASTLGGIWKGITEMSLEDAKNTLLGDWVQRKENYEKGTPYDWYQGGRDGVSSVKYAMGGGLSAIRTGLEGAKEAVTTIVNRGWRVASKASLRNAILRTAANKAIAQKYWQKIKATPNEYLSDYLDDIDDFDKWYDNVFIGKSTTFEGHHIIPKQALESQNLRDILDWAEKNDKLGEFDFGGEANGMMLMKRKKGLDGELVGDHANHPQYNQQIISVLENQNGKFSRNLSFEQRFENLKSFSNNLKSQIENQVVNGNNIVNDITITF